ncbi:MAG: hypothetical protein KBD53_07565 [Candidatus Omnitrophica bacterium]|nr:hypothetical protein [Candidatus Omnitrophota bacterium]
MQKLKNNGGMVSMIEVIVTAMIFSTAFLGIYASMSTMHTKATTSMTKLKAAYAAKGFLDDLRQQVRADTWDSGNFVPGNYYLSVDNFEGNYTVSDVPGLNLRQVTVSLTYGDED